MIIDARPGKPIFIGRTGENESRTVRFFVGDVLHDFPGATLTVLNRRPGDEAAYPVNPAYFEVDGNHLFWTLQSGDLTTDGDGQCELVATRDGTVAISIKYRTTIESALYGSETPPEPWESWVQDVTDAADRAEAAAALLEHPGVEVETLPAGAQATGGYEDGVFTFGIPRGDKGETGETGPRGERGPQGETGATGATPAFRIGTVETGAAGTDAKAEISGTPEAPVLSLTIPRGDPGSALIDDTAGAGDKTVAWSADKSAGAQATTRSTEKNILNIYTDMNAGWNGGTNGLTIRKDGNTIALDGTMTGNYRIWNASADTETRYVYNAITGDNANLLFFTEGHIYRVTVVMESGTAPSQTGISIRVLRNDASSSNDSILSIDVSGMTPGAKATANFTATETSYWVGLYVAAGRSISNATFRIFFEDRTEAETLLTKTDILERKAGFPETLVKAVDLSSATEWATTYYIGTNAKVQTATTQPTARVIAIPITGGNTYQIWKAESTVMRTASGPEAEPAPNATLNNYTTATGSRITGRTNPGDGYLYIQLFTSADEANYSIAKALDTLTVYDVSKADRKTRMYAGAEIEEINHRGYNSTAPENTIPAYQESKRQGYGWIECDVQITADGIPVICHDGTINRTARNADGTEIENTVSIAGATYADLLTYDFGIWKDEAYAGTKIPTLAEILDFARKADMKVAIELKGSINATTFQTIKSTVEAYAMQTRVEYFSGTLSIAAIAAEAIRDGIVGYAISGAPTANTINSLTTLTGNNNVVRLHADPATTTAEIGYLDAINAAGYEIVFRGHTAAQVAAAPGYAHIFISDAILPKDLLRESAGVPDPEYLHTEAIDDTAGTGDTEKIWSADRTAEESATLRNEIAGSTITHLVDFPTTELSATAASKTIKFKGNRFWQEAGETSSTSYRYFTLCKGRILVSSTSADADLSSLTEDDFITLPETNGTYNIRIDLSIKNRNNANGNNPILALARYTDNTLTTLERVILNPNAGATAIQKRTEIFENISIPGRKFVLTISSRNSNNEFVAYINFEPAAPNGNMVSVSGTTPAITGEPGKQYMCGTVSSITITPPQTGIIDVTFTSGTTPALLTAPGVTFPTWFNSASLDANTIYEISILNGMGAVMTWPI